MMKSINILYLIPSLSNSGGMERVLCEKANKLVDRGYSVYIFTTEMNESESSFYKLDERIILFKSKNSFNSFHNYNVFIKIIYNSIYLYRYKSELKSFIKKNNIDICVSMGGKELEFFSSISGNVRLVFESHFNPNVRSSFLKDFKGNNFFWNMVGRFRDWQYIQQTKSLDCVVVLTKAAQKHWKKTHHNIKIIKNPIPFKITQKSYSRTFYRAIAIGRLEPQKGFDLLISAWRKVAEINPNWILDIYGEGSAYNELLDMIKINNLSGSINLKGITKDVKKELLTSDFYVMSSRYEGLPMVLLESIACGLPIVSFDCPTGPAEIIENNDCGLLVKNGCLDELSIKINQLIDSDTLRECMGNAAVHKARKYDINIIIDEWDDLFSSLV